MTVSYYETTPSRLEYSDLFLTTGWNDEYHLTPEELERAIADSWYSVSAYHDSRLIGYGRVIADGVYHALIVDMIVHPDFQRKGIGGAILKKLVERCRVHKIRDVQLFCADGKAKFYEKFGFVSRPGAAPGMELKKGGYA